VASFVLNKNGQDFVYVWGGNKKTEDPYCWGFNPRENVWKSVNDLAGEYGFTVGERGYAMQFTASKYMAGVAKFVE